MKKHTFQPYDHTYNMENACKIVNVFFPTDCKQNCALCTTKEWYKEINEEEWRKSLKKLMENDPDIVIITGGEPLVDHSKFYETVKYIKRFNPYNYKLELYLSTAWYDWTISKELIDFINTEFNGINISRHDPRNIIGFDKIKIPVRINCMITPDLVIENHIDYFINHKATLVFREDYRYVDRKELFEFDSPVLKFLTDHFELESSQYCHFCCNFNFKTQKELKIRYHKGTNLTSAKIGNITEHMEIILAPNGEIYTDWNKTKEGLNELLI